MLTDLEAELLKRTQKEEAIPLNIPVHETLQEEPVFGDGDPEIDLEEEPSSQEELYLKAAMYVKMFAPSFNILVDFVYSSLILPKDLSIGELIRIQQAGRLKTSKSHQEAEYYKSIDTMLFGYSNAKILEEEYEVFIESFIPVADYFSKKSKGPFGGLAFVLSSKLVPIIVQGYMNRDKIKHRPVHQTQVVNDPIYTHYEEA